MLDTSAIMAILFGEPVGGSLTAAIESDEVRLISAATLVESTLVVEGRQGEAGGRELDLFLHRHPARLNYGDCFSYALTKASGGEPLLFLGEDFAKTDITAVG